MELCTVLKVQWEEEHRETYFESHWPRLYQSQAFQRLRQAVLSTAFQWGTLLSEGVDAPRALLIEINS